MTKEDCIEILEERIRDIKMLETFCKRVGIQTDQTHIGKVIGSLKKVIEFLQS